MITPPSLWSTVNSFHNKAPVFLVEIETYGRSFTNVEIGFGGSVPWLVSLEDLALTISDLDGGADLAEFTFVVQDRGRVIVASMPTFTFEGKAVTLKTGFQGIAVTDYVTLFTGRIDQVNSVNGGLEWQFVCSDNSILLEPAVYLTGDDGRPTDGDHRKTVIGHPLDILEAILVDHLEIDIGLINLTRLHAYRDGIFDGFEFSFSLDTPPNAKDFIEAELMKPLGGYMWVNNLGQFDFSFFYPESDASVRTLTEAVTFEIPDVLQSDLVNSVRFRFDHVEDTEGNTSSADFLAESINNFALSIDRYGLTGEQIIESKGMRSGLAGFLLAKIISRLIVFRYGLKNLRIETMPFTWTECILEPGDVVTLENSSIPDREAGAIGISKKLVVLDRNWRFMDGVVEYTLIDGSYLDKFKAYLITTDGQADYTASDSAHQLSDMFLCNDSNQYSTGAPGHTLA